MAAVGAGTSAIVVGASIAGMLTARALADRVDDVLVLERERLTDAADEPPHPRGHVPQGRHLHLLLAAGLDQLCAWFPGIDAELEAAGAVRVDGTRAWFFQQGAYRARGDWGTVLMSMTRPLLEQTVRRRLADVPNVRIEDGVRVDRVHRQGRRVAGVEVAAGSGVEVRPADLVADCSGRSSRIAHDLESSGVLAPPVSLVSIDCAYASCLLARGPDDLDGGFLVCGPTPPRSYRIGAVLPVEGDRWMVTLAGVHGDPPPTDDEGFRAFTRTLLSPGVAQVVERCERVSPVAHYRFPASRRRHYEKVPDLLPGLVVVGDAACSFDPVYGQGMACAALQAASLGELLRTLPPGSPELPRRFHRRAAKILDAPWSIAVGADFLHPLTQGPKAPGTDLVNRYVLRVLLASHTDVAVARRFNRVLQLVEPPSALMRPSTVARVLRAARRSPVRTGRALVHPRVGPVAGPTDRSADPRG
ncbi:FAD-dependent oxidoreductase [Angustibacter luteus]|uniref:FAD-dependent oxidoreductase n=1 Tax=Angustibacter luteus TaxID=658456 RepID=A0ABW1JE40_9ACTN